MDINQLSEIVKKKILEKQSVEEIYLEDLAKVLSGEK